MDEAVFARHLGSPQVMAEQVAHLLEMTEWPNVTLRVVPFGAPSYPGIDGSFIYLGFHSPDIPDVVHVEGMLGNFILDRPEDVARYVEAFQDTRDRATLSPSDTVAWLHEFRNSTTRSGSPVADARRRTRQR
jgi:hypothetical protein